MRHLNRAFVQADSPVQASQAFVSYSGVLRGGPTSTVISYRVDIQPTLEKYVLQTGEADQSGHVVDLEWRGITINEPLVVNAPDVGQININYPIGLLQALYPTLAQKFESTQAREIMDEPISNFDDFNAPMDTWHLLFDPVGTYGGSVGLSGTGGAKALSVYSLGESSLREGTHTIQEKDATATIDGANVNVHIYHSPSKRTNTDCRIFKGPRIRWLMVCDSDIGGSGRGTDVIWGIPHSSAFGLRRNDGRNRHIYPLQGKKVTTII